MYENNENKTHHIKTIVIYAFIKLLYSQNFNTNLINL